MVICYVVHLDSKLLLMLWTNLAKNWLKRITIGTRIELLVLLEKSTLVWMNHQHDFIPSIHTGFVGEMHSMLPHRIDFSYTHKLIDPVKPFCSLLNSWAIAKSIVGSCPQSRSSEVCGVIMFPCFDKLLSPEWKWLCEYRIP